MQSAGRKMQNGEGSGWFDFVVELSRVKPFYHNLEFSGGLA